MIDLSIIIVSWNCKEHLHTCLQSIRKYPPLCKYVIVVVDNASSDGTVESICSIFPEVRILAHETNSGFAAANNLGLQMIEARSYLLLNPDTIVLPGALQALADFADSTTACWVAGPALLNADKTPQRTGVRFPNLWNLLVETFFLDRVFPKTKIFGRHRELYEDYSRARMVDYVQGSCLLIKHEALHTMGFMDEHYFMFFEETDWCWRAWLLGGEVWFYPGASIIHLGGGEFGHYQEATIQYYHRSLLLFYAKYYSSLSGIALRMIMIVRVFLRIGIWTIIGLLFTKRAARAFSAVKGYSAVLKMMIGVRKV